VTDQPGSPFSRVDLANNLNVHIFLERFEFIVSVEETFPQQGDIAQDCNFPIFVWLDYLW